MTSSRKIAIVGAGMAAISCARTLLQWGHRVTMFEKKPAVGGRMATFESPFGTFDHGTQYFTARDPRFVNALVAASEVSRPWQVAPPHCVDAPLHSAVAKEHAPETLWVATPRMDALVQHWSDSAGPSLRLELGTCITHMEPDSTHAGRWQLRANRADATSEFFSGFDQLVLAIPCARALALLKTDPNTAPMQLALHTVSVFPCWTLMLAFPQAMQPGLGSLGPAWDTARSAQQRIAWMARESSKPGRGTVERWCIHANANWSAEHLQEEPSLIQAKLLRTFAEITGIYTQPAWLQTHRWLYAQTQTPLGQPCLWDAQADLGLCGDWCLGCRVEDAYLSGLELALSMQ